VKRWAVEIKLTSGPGPADIGRLNHAADLIDAKRRILVCRVAEDIVNASLLVTSVPGWLMELVAP